MRSKIINGKRIFLPGIVDCSVWVQDRPERLSRRRTLVLSYAKSDEHDVLHRAIERVGYCGRSFSQSPHGRRAIKAGAPRHPPCGKRLCPDCEQALRQSWANGMFLHLNGIPRSHLWMITLKIPTEKSIWPAQHTKRGLLQAIRSAKKAFAAFLRTSALLASHDGPFGCGVWRLQFHWNIANKSWDVHYHIIAAARVCLPSDIRDIRAQWGRCSGRSDHEAVDCERVKNTNASIRYLSREMASVFSKAHPPRQLTAQLQDAWSMALNHPLVTAEYLWALRQRPGNFIGKWGSANMYR